MKVLFFPPCPTTNSGMQNGSSVRTRRRCAHVFARLGADSLCSVGDHRQEFLHRSSVRSLLRVSCLVGWYPVSPSSPSFHDFQGCNYLPPPSPLRWRGQVPPRTSNAQGREERRKNKKKKLCFCCSLPRVGTVEPWSMFRETDHLKKTGSFIGLVKVWSCWKLWLQVKFCNSGVPLYPEVDLGWL